MTSVYDQLVAAHKADSFPIKIMYSKDAINAEQIKADVYKSGPQRYVQPAPLPVGNVLRESTNGDVKVVQAFIIVFAKTAKEAVEALEAWLIRVGFVSSPGVVGKPRCGPWTYSTLSLLSYSPVGDVEEFAQPYGQIYAVEQYIRISIA